MMLAAMLAQTYKGAALRGPHIIEPKLDGIRAVWDGAKLWTRSDKPIYNPPAILSALRAYLPQIALDGELYAGSWNETHSVIRSAKPTECPEMVFYVFDITATPGQTLQRRKAQLDELFEAFDLPDCIQRVPWAMLTGDPKDIAAGFVTDGHEGAMLKGLYSPYLAGVRSPHWQKVKFSKEVDAIIIGAVVGEGRNSATLGAILVRDENGDEYRVGSGFTDADRESLWTMHTDDRLAGLPVTIHYQHDARIKGRFPRFVRLRDLEIEHA